MPFWGVEVEPGKPFTLTSDELGGMLILSQATLGIANSPEKSALRVRVGNQTPIFVCSLIPGLGESIPLKLEFDEDDDVTFSVVGPNSIHLSGYVLRSKHNDDDSNDNSFELETDSEYETDSEFDNNSDFEKYCDRVNDIVRQGKKE